MNFLLSDSLQPAAQKLAAEGVFIGTSSWKYQGWVGQLFAPERYLTRGKFSKAKFEENCLSEYAAAFSTVCVDAGYYAFPNAEYLEGLARQVPPHFRFGFKVTDEITMKRFLRLPRYGARAGAENPHFLNAELFATQFLGPCKSIRPNMGPLIFEFSHFHPNDFARGRDFLAVLDRFLGDLPQGWQYAVEIRNKTFLHPEYFAVLHAHQVAHCYNAWEKMPPVADQLAVESSRTTDFFAARFLLTAGRKYESAVKTFSPYTETKSPDPAARAAARQIVAEARQKRGRPSFLFVNNRLEGNALNTIAAIMAPENAADTTPPAH